MDDYLSKPLRLSELRMMMQKWMPLDSVATSKTPVTALAVNEEQARVGALLEASREFPLVSRRTERTDR